MQLNGPVAKALREQGVLVQPIGAAQGNAKQIELPVASGLAGSSTTLLTHRGGLLLRTNDRKLRLKRLRLFLSNRSRVTAKVGNEELDLFQILRGGKRNVDSGAGTVELAQLKLKLTRDAAQAIATGLELKELQGGRFATLRAKVRGLIAAGSPETTPGEKTPESKSCPLPSGAGPEPETPLPVASPPPGSAAITGATIDWHVRESFIRYVNTGEGTSVLGGATADPPVLRPGASAPLTYTFHFPFAGGWHDAGANLADPADDTAAIGFSGAVRFLYSAHGIDLTTETPEIEIAGARSRAIFTVNDGKSTQRQVLVNLDLSRAAAITATGGSVTYDRVPGAVPSGTATSVFGGFYAPGTEFGCFTVRYSTAP